MLPQHQHHENSEHRQHCPLLTPPSVAEDLKLQPNFRAVERIAESVKLVRTRRSAVEACSRAPLPNTSVKMQQYSVRLLLFQPQHGQDVNEHVLDMSLETEWTHRSIL